MATVDTSSSTLAYGSSFTAGIVGASGASSTSGTPGVASLDTPQLNQTKIEIRSLLAEIAELSSSKISLGEFLDGMLPRICTAMGATAAAVWSMDPNRRLQLMGSHQLPSALEDLETDSFQSHLRILQCIVDEGQPILVPPGSTRLNTDRPTNPIEECLLVVPIRINERIDTLLEVIQPPGGGPAAQRGYLRFVAQMADLLSDYLRRHRLNELTRDAEYVRCLQTQWVAISSAKSTRQKWQAIADGLNRLLDGHVTLTLARLGSTWNVQSVSGLPAFDNRSESITAVQRLAQAIAPQLASHTCALTLSHDSNLEGLSDGLIDRACELLGCSQVTAMQLTHDNDRMAIIAMSETADGELIRTRINDLATSLNSMLSGLLPSQSWWKVSWGRGLSPSQPATSKWLRLERWIVRASTAGLAIAVASFPTPDQLHTLAVLEAQNKQFYFAPANATIDKVMIKNDQPVKAGDPLIQLVDKQLEARLDEAQGQRLASAAQLEQDRSALLRGQLPPTQQVELESRSEQLKITLASLDQQIALMKSQSDELLIKARQDAVVTTWDAVNRLQGRPVAAGQLLLSTCESNSSWTLQVSIPEHQAGFVREKLERSPQGLSVPFTLSSYPNQVLEGRLIRLSQQIVKDEVQGNKVIGTVMFDERALPSKTDGAVARAVVDCGKVPAIWLVIRDAYRELDRWIRMTW